jgi:hypothetical protein
VTAASRTAGVLVVLVSARGAWAADASTDKNHAADMTETLQAGPKSEDRPWAKNVSPQSQKQAQASFVEGNALLRDSLFLQAVEKYREALKYWNHPGIHYNLSLALLGLDRPIELHAHLKEAILYGPAPLDQEKFEHARSYLRLVEAQLATLDVSCEHEAQVTLDGQPLFKAPGHYEGLVRAGYHTIAAARQGYVATQLTRALLPGQTTRLRMNLYTANELIEYRRRWPAAEGWAVGATVAGGALLIAGGVLTWQAAQRFDDFDAGIRACAGCVPDAALADKKSQGQTLRTLSYVSYGAGGAALLTGVALMYLNRALPFRLDPGERGVAILPAVGPGQVGALVAARY